MSIRRGKWVPETTSLHPVISNKRYGPKPTALPKNGLSNSENHLRSRQSNTSLPAPQGISDQRREGLRDSVSTIGNESNASPLIVYSDTYKRNQEMKKQFGLEKTASVGTSGGRNGFGGTSNTVTMAPEVYSPLFQMANLQLPRDRITMNAWNRNFYDTHPLVHNCINLHATYPISKINIKCKDARIQDFFNNMAEEMDLMGALQSIALEFYKIGECFPYAEMDEKKGTWKRITVQNPDYIHVRTAVLSGESTISLRPDAALMRLVQSNNPADVQLRQNIPDEILFHVKKGNNIPLDNFHISHLKMLSSPYDIHGTSMIVSIYKDLMLYDRLRESKFAQAGNLINPITLIKVGGSGEGEFHPTSQDLENYRQIFETAAYDKDFKIITHAAVSVERVGAAGQIIDIAPDMAFIVDNILFGLMVPKAIITQDGASFSNASIGLEVLKQRYEAFRNMMAKWLVKKIFAPISEIQGFYEYEGGNKKLIVPEIDWNQMILYDVDNYMSILNNLATTNPEKPTISKQTLFRSLGLNIDEERRRIKEEMIQNTITEKEQQIMKTMPLGALRSLKPDQDIVEPNELALPGTISSGDNEDAGSLSPELPPLPTQESTPATPITMEK